LLLRTGSNISATAGTAQSFGNGGNVTINIPDGFIVAVPAENSNISANAFLGNGGNVNITTQGIFGIEFQPAPTPLSDITASSEFGLQGTVTIETPDVDPSKDLVNLPETVVDASRLVAQNCGAGTGVASTLGEFVVTGRGGLPPSPTEQLSAQSNLSTWETLEEAADTTETTAAANPAATAVPAAPTQIVEFQGWVVDEQGNIVLTAEALTATPHAPWAPAATCQAQQG
jgi:large exoprotein involved in heme utilization and adhesion